MIYRKRMNGGPVGSIRVPSKNPVPSMKGIGQPTKRVGNQRVYPSRSIVSRM